MRLEQVELALGLDGLLDVRLDLLGFLRIVRHQQGEQDERGGSDGGRGHPALPRSSADLHERRWPCQGRAEGKYLNG